jgi:crotonobetainyl-CoA:carnitine CoA-transferase CaiB-like acyl-CoA transferase
VPVAPVNTVAEALTDEQVLAREMVIPVEHPTRGTLRQAGSPIKIGGARAPRRPAPPLGADTDAILADVLGYGPDRIATLRATGAI